MVTEVINLTPKQQETAIHLFKTRTFAKVTRRRDLGNGNYELYTFEREMGIVDFPVNDEEFALTAHRDNITAPLSKIYVNLRNLSEGTLSLIGQGITDAIPEEDRDAFGAGIPEAGTPIGHAAIPIVGIEEINLFIKAPLENKQRLLPNPEAIAGVGRRVILFDDLITEARTKLDAIAVAEKLGYKVMGVAVLVDREQGGRQQLAEKGYKLYAAMKLSDMLQLYLSIDLINQARYDEVESYLAPFRK